MSQTYEQSQQQPQQQSQQGGGQTGQPTPQQFRTRSYLSQNVRTSSIQRLNRILADSIVLRSQVNYAHWNVKGPQFYSLHQLFEEIADEFEDHIDEIGERITSLGGQAIATTYTAASLSTIPPLSTTAVTDMELVEMLADRIATHDANLGQDIQSATQAGDVDTADLLNEISRAVGKQRWFLEAHMQGQPVQESPGRQQPAQSPTQK